MKLEFFHQLFTKLKHTFKSETLGSRISEEYQKVKKEVRPLKTNVKFRPGKDNNRDISAI